MQFRVPQFIDVEDKIFGPLTLKQFFYLLGAGGMAFLFFKLIPIKIVAIALTIPISGFFIALAFVRINDRPFIDFAESVFSFMMKGKIYIWKQPKQKLEDSEMAPLIFETTKETITAKANGNKLHEIAFGLDVQNSNSHNSDNE